MLKVVQNIAVDDEGFFVGWKTDSKQYHFAVHVLLEPEFQKPSKCFFYNTAEEANKAKDYFTSKFNGIAQRVELCKVQYDLKKPWY